MCEKQWESVVNTAKLTCGVVFEEDKIEWARKPGKAPSRPAYPFAFRVCETVVTAVLSFLSRMLTLSFC